MGTPNQFHTICLLAQLLLSMGLDFQLYNSLDLESSLKAHALKALSLACGMSEG